MNGIMPESSKMQTDENTKHQAAHESCVNNSGGIVTNTDCIQNIEPDAGEDLSSEALLSDETSENGDIDLSNTDDFEFVLEDGDSSDQTPKDKHSAQRQEAQKRMLSLEIARQKGVEIHGNHITVPGRVALMPISLLAVLLSVIGFAGSFIHFSILAQNYLLAVFVIVCIVVAQIIIYHSSYRACRTTMGVIHVLGCMIVTTLVDWAFLDIIFHPKTADEPHGLLGIAVIAYTCVPLVLMLHLVYLGRGKRDIFIKRKKTQADKPTKILKKAPDKPTKILKKAA